ncbi:hypothetical protein FGO68_gene6178 [Halteria grandinella]|uniref:START domain-containing protein n=1 Tax=Halteria grandinella TaxID=5974 RepID=A0A8J8NM62_HALGN|nr:hypothetical protein FGO68_gene6178 [Halteria grandinella]
MNEASSEEVSAHSPEQQQLVELVINEQNIDQLIENIVLDQPIEEEAEQEGPSGLRLEEAVEVKDIAEIAAAVIEEVKEEVKELAHVPVVKTQRQIQQETLEREFKEQIEGIMQAHVVHEDKKKAIKVHSRKTYLNGGEHLQFLVGIEHIGVTPQQYYDMVKDLKEFIKVGSNMRDNFELLEEEKTLDGEPIQTFANFGKKRAMMQGRMNFDTRYFNKSELIVVLSSQGNDGIRDAYLAKNPECNKKYSHSTTILSGFKFDPIFDKADATKVIGTHMFLLSTADHGSIPKWIIEKFAPKGMSEYIESFVEVMKKRL